MYYIYILIFSSWNEKISYLTQIFDWVNYINISRSMYVLAFPCWPCMLNFKSFAWYVGRWGSRSEKDDLEQVIIRLNDMHWDAGSLGGFETCIKDAWQFSCFGISFYCQLSELHFAALIWGQIHPQLIRCKNNKTIRISRIFVILTDSFSYIYILQLFIDYIPIQFESLVKSRLYYSSMILISFKTEPFY